MIISGINKFSIINYPGKVSCVLFAKGCPLKCQYCYNKILLTEPTIPWQEIQAFLRKRIGVLDAVVFSGGEPMLQPDQLLDACNYVKNLGYLIGLHITGLNYDNKNFQQIIDLADWIGLDFKATKEKYLQVCGLPFENFQRTLDLLISKNKNFEVRTTLDQKLDRQDLLRMEKFLLDKGVNSWMLQRLMLEEGSFDNPPYSLQFDNISTTIR